MPDPDASLYPEQRQNAAAGRRWLAGMGVFLALAGLLFTWVLWRAFTLAETTRAWVETPCLIVSSRVQSERPSPNSNLAHRAEIRYAYEFAGKTWTGTRIKRVDSATGHEERVRAVVAEYPAGRRTVCHVNPARPEEAVLRHGTRAALYSIWFPLLFVAGGIGMTWNALRRSRFGD